MRFLPASVSTTDDADSFGRLILFNEFPIVTIPVEVPVLILVAKFELGFEPALIFVIPPALVRIPVFVIPPLEVTAPVSVEVPPIVPFPLILKLEAACWVV